MIPVSYQASFRYLLRHPWQLALSLMGIAIGVAVIVAVDLGNGSARKAFLLSMDQVTGETTHQVVGGARGVPEDIYTRLRVDGGIRSLAPIVAGSVEIGDTLVDVLGVDLFAEQEIRTFTSEATVPTETGGQSEQNLFRAFLTTPGVVTMSASTADGLGIRIGESFPLVAGGIDAIRR